MIRLSKVEELRELLIQRQGGMTHAAFAALIPGVGPQYWRKIRSRFLPMTTRFCVKVRIAMPEYTGLTIDAEAELISTDE